MERLDTLKEAAGRGIAVWAFLGPFLPMVTDGEENLEALISAVAQLPVTHVYVDRVNFRSGVAASLREMAAEHFPELAADYRWLGSDRNEDQAYADQLRTRVARLADRYGVSRRIRMGF